MGSHRDVRAPLVLLCSPQLLTPCARALSA